MIVIEDAYLLSRYFTREYSREEAEDMVRLVKEVMSLLESVLEETRRGFKG